MSTIIYSKSAGTNNAAIGKLETPIKMVIKQKGDEPDIKVKRDKKKGDEDED